MTPNQNVVQSESLERHGSFVVSSKLGKPFLKLFELLRMIGEIFMNTRPYAISGSAIGMRNYAVDKWEMLRGLVVQDLVGGRPTAPLQVMQ